MGASSPAPGCGWRSTGARLRTAALGRPVEAVTDGDGGFVLRGLVPGAAAIVQVDAAGYGSLRRTLVTPPDARTETRSFSLVPHRRGRPTPPTGKVGLVVAQDDQDRVVVRAAAPGFSAAQAGLTPGDTIVAIDGLDVAELGLEGVVTLLGGDHGTPLHLRYQKPDGSTHEARLTRV